MSLRLSTLDPKEARAAKDCRTCKRRRIRCDRSLPSCKKCGLRGLECPGYGLRIRWDQGVASRGRLSGKAVPVLDDSTSSGSSSQDRSSLHYNSLEEPPPPIQPPPTPASEGNRTPVLAFPESSDMKLTLSNPFATGQDFKLQALPSGIDHSCAKGLLRYFDHIVAPMMTWIDGPDNEWRLIMLPLALSSQPLLLAMLALSAEHYTCKTGLQWPFPDGNTSVTLRDQSLRALAENLRAEMSGNNTAGNDGHVAEIFGTIITLCNLEMINSESELWRVHWSAVRTITRRWTTTSLLCHPVDTQCRSLVVEAFVYDAMASCTTFDEGEPIPVEVIHPDDYDVMVELLQVVQEITKAERRRHAATHEVEGTPLSDMGTLITRLLGCHTRDRELAKQMQFPAPSVELRADFDTLIDFWHYASVLYGMQALMDPHQSTLDRKEYMHRGYECFNRIKHIDHYQQDIIWPLFIIGAEAKGYPVIQNFAERQIIDLMDATGWRNSTRALDFLKLFWASDSTDESCWIDYARFQATNGFTFLLV